MRQDSSHSAAATAPRPINRWLLPAAIVLTLGFVAVALMAYLTPERYSLRVAAPVGSVHEEIARILADCATENGIELQLIRETSGASPLDLLRQGRADLCFVSGSPPLIQDIEEVLLLKRETLHLLARPELAIAGIDALRGRRVNVGPADADWRSAVDSLFTFGGLKPGVDFDASNHNADELLKLSESGLPDAIATVGGACPPEVAAYVRKFGFQPMRLPFLGALARLEPHLNATTLPAAIYSAEPIVPTDPLPTVTVALRLAARADAPERAIKALLKMIFDGPFARLADLPDLDESTLGQDHRMRLHPGTLAYMHRGDPWLTSDLVTETEELRSFLAASVFGVVLIWRWVKHRRSRVVMEAVEHVHALEREALTVETRDEVDTQELMRLRRRLAHIKQRLVEQVVSRERFEDPFLTDLVSHIDSVRHSLLETAAHRSHLTTSESEPSGAAARSQRGGKIPGAPPPMEMTTRR